MLIVRREQLSELERELGQHPTKRCALSRAKRLGRKKAALTANGSSKDRKAQKKLIDRIRNSGPKGRKFIESLENAPTNTRIFFGTSAEKKDGTVIPLSSTGGGVTLRPSESKSGDTEVYVDTSNLINYTAVDGTTATETPEGLLLHELGHARLLNDGDPAQTTGGNQAEANVRTLTNPIRVELGMKPEK